MSESTTAPSSSPQAPPVGDISARAATYYRRTRYLMVALLLAYGAWSIYDGFISWPASNARIAQLRAERIEAEKAQNQARVTEIAKELEGLKEHSTTDVMFNKVLGVLLPPLGLFMLFYSLHNSRGEIRLTADDVLHAPGHPPVPVDQMTAMDRKLWDRKGIAFVEYELPGGEKGRIRLDDFIYERKPIDAIHDRILARLDPEAAAAANAKGAVDAPAASPASSDDGSIEKPN